jgi:hypothetical protein
LSSQIWNFIDNLVNKVKARISLMDFGLGLRQYLEPSGLGEQDEEAAV